MFSVEKNSIHPKIMANTMYWSQGLLKVCSVDSFFFLSCRRQASGFMTGASLVVPERNFWQVMTEYVLVLLPGISNWLPFSDFKPIPDWLRTPKDAYEQLYFP